MVLRIFIGFDPIETEAFHVLAHSIMRRASQPVAIVPLMLSQLKRVFWRERHPLQSTDFSFTRFLVPYLCDYSGFAVFMDCDMLVVDDIAQLFEFADPALALRVVKHSHEPKSTLKFSGNVQTVYPRKNWSSVMLFNCAMCQALTTDYVNTASGLDLHQFNWLDDSLIGDLPPRWNHLVDYDADLPIEGLSNLHYTSGGPWFSDYADCSYADAWRAERRSMRQDGSLNSPALS